MIGLVGLAAGSALAYRHRHKIVDFYKIDVPIIKSHVYRVTRATKEYKESLNDTYRRIKWLVQHPEILGPAGSGMSYTTWLDPFYGDAEQDFRALQEKHRQWSWADAPNIFVGDEEVEPTGKVLARS